MGDIVFLFMCYGCSGQVRESFSKVFLKYTKIHRAIKGTNYTEI
jgi:hypothetical protein